MLAEVEEGRKESHADERVLGSLLEELMSELHPQGGVGGSWVERAMVSWDVSGEGQGQSTEMCRAGVQDITGKT